MIPAQWMENQTMSAARTTIQVDEAFRIVDSVLSGVKAPGETVAVREALGRVVLDDQRSELDLPPFNKAAMDGYAVAAGDCRDSYRLVDTVPAGQLPAAELLPGTAARIMTGAPVPAGAGKVIKQEDTREHDGIVEVLRHDTAANICGKAEDVRRGQVIVAAGTLLDPVADASLIGCGITSVRVARRLRAAVISTGDELAASLESLGPGKIMDSNGPMLAALARGHGMEVVGECTAPDDSAAISSALGRAIAMADLVLVSGGVSAGMFDCVIGAMNACGLTVHFSRVAMRPGKPTVFATAPAEDGRPRVVFGLPGNPVSAFVAFHLFVVRAAALLTGRRPVRREFTLPLAGEFRRRHAERTEYVPACISAESAVEPVDYHGSAHLAALLQADGFFVVPNGTAAVRAGHPVSFMPIPGLARW